MTAAGRKLQRLGSAAIVIRLGYNHWSPTITVTREDDGAVLLATPVAADAWVRLWAVLESFGTDDE